MRWSLPILAGATLALLTVAGCKKAEEPPAENRIVEQPPAPPPPAPVVEKPAAEPKVEAPKPKPAPEPSAEQQMLDDADATGMTAHVSRGQDDASAPPSDAAQGNGQN